MPRHLDEIVTSHTVHTCDMSQVPLTIHEVQVGNERRWLIDDEARDLGAELVGAPWNPSTHSWQDVTAEERRWALLVTVAGAANSEDRKPFRRRQNEALWQEAVGEARTGLQEQGASAAGADPFDTAVFDDPRALAAFIRERHHVPGSAIAALEDRGSLSGQGTYAYRPGDLARIRPEWSVRTDYDLDAFLRPDLPYLAVREGYGSAPINKLAEAETTYVSGLCAGMALAATSRGRPGANASLMLGSQEIAATYMAPNPEEIKGAPRACLSFSRHHGLFDEFRRADARRVLDQCATETRSSKPFVLGSFGLAAETAYDMLDPRSPEGREMGGFISAMRRSCSDGGKSASSEVPPAWGSRMAEFAKIYPDKTMALSMAQIAMTIAHQAQESAKQNGSKTGALTLD